MDSLRAFVAGLVVFVAAASVDAAQLYWIDAQGIHRANTDGSSQQLIVPVTGISGMAVDAVANRLYWIEGSFPFDIRYSTLDGANPQPFLNVEYAGGGIFVHPTTHDVWWGGRRDVDFNTAVLYTSPDGSASTYVFMPNKPDLNQFFIDAGTEKIYNLDTDDNGITSYNLDGSGFQLLVSSGAMAVDPAGGSIYYRGSGGVHRMNLDGTDQQPIFDPGVGNIRRGLAIDPQSSTLFISQSFPGVIYRVNTDGTGLTPIISTIDTGARQLLVVEPVPEPSTLAMLLAAVPLGYLAYRRGR